MNREHILNCGYLAGYMHKEASDTENILTRFLQKKPKKNLMQELFKPTPSLVGEIFKPRQGQNISALAEILKTGLKKTPAKVAEKVTENIVKK